MTSSLNPTNPSRRSILAVAAALSAGSVSDAIAAALAETQEPFRSSLAEGIKTYEAMTAEERRALLDAYNCWLEMERRELALERAGGDPDLADAYLRNVVIVGHRANSYHDDDRATASSRAQHVLSAVGCDWREQSA
jgi:hypothetical protein